MIGVGRIAVGWAVIATVFAQAGDWQRIAARALRRARLFVHGLAAMAPVWMQPDAACPERQSES